MRKSDGATGEEVERRLLRFLGFTQIKWLIIFYILI